MDTVADLPTFNQKPTLAVPKPDGIQRLALKNERRDNVDNVRDSHSGQAKDTITMKAGKGMMYLNAFERRDSVDTVADTNPVLGRVASTNLNQSMDHLASLLLQIHR